MTAKEYINTFDSKEEMFDWLSKNLAKVGSYGMCFDMSNVFEIHQRHYQPCIGGNLRKYGDTGHEDVLPPQRAKDFSPGDLSNKKNQRSHIWRYPDTGNPCGVGYPWGFDPSHTEFVQYIFSDESPWRKAFNSSEFVQLVRNDYCITGFIIKTGDIDPTVLVNLLKFLQEIYAVNNLWHKCIQKGFTKKEALTVAAYFSTPSPQAIRNNYQWDASSSISRVLNSDPVDITGGLWSARYDYNRPDMACPFRPVDPEEKKNSVHFAKEITTRMKESKKDFFDVSLGILKEVQEGKLQ
jgi:hypothetical protein